MRTPLLVMASTTLGASVLVLALRVAGTVGLAVVAVLGSAVALVAIRAQLGAEPLSAQPEPKQPWPLRPFHRYRWIAMVLRWGVGRPNPALPQLLVRLARAVLAERHRIELDRDPDTARRLLGEPAWLALHPDADSPLHLADIERFVDRLERL